ncbi:MAG: hypothetical protein U5J62_09540 [Desulfurivibrio sp.]|nr:hypothetical protein [Desulfurivibrio sp.]
MAEGDCMVVGKRQDFIIGGLFTLIIKVVSIEKSGTGSAKNACQKKAGGLYIPLFPLLRTLLARFCRRLGVAAVVGLFIIPMVLRE